MDPGFRHGLPADIVDDTGRWNMPRPPRSSEPGALGTRDRIVEAARQIVAQKGVASLRIRAVARAVGIREGSIYNHFRGREEIVKAIFRNVDTAMSPLGAVLDLSTTPQEQLVLLRDTLQARGFAGFLADTAEHLILHFRNNPDSLRLIHAVLSERAHDESARAAYDEVFRTDMSRALLAICTAARERGVVEPSIEPGVLTRLVVAVFEHAVSESAAPDGPERFASALRDLLGAIGAMAAP